jgi:hypothetical protein
MKIRFRGSKQLGRYSILLVIAAVLLGGCSKHPKATSRESLDFIKQVYTACNTKNSKRLVECVERLSELESEGKVSSEEIKSFKRILDMAGKGEWDSAQTLALKFASDQVR